MRMLPFAPNAFEGQGETYSFYASRTEKIWDLKKKKMPLSLGHGDLPGRISQAGKGRKL